MEDFYPYSQVERDVGRTRQFYRQLAAMKCQFPDQHDIGDFALEVSHGPLHISYSGPRSTEAKRFLALFSADPLGKEYMATVWEQVERTDTSYFNNNQARFRSAREMERQGQLERAWTRYNSLLQDGYRTADCQKAMTRIRKTQGRFDDAPSRP